MSEPLQLTAIRAARLIDGTGAPPLDNVTVLISGGVIVEVGVRDEVGVPDGARILDAADRTLMPGMIDAHMHFLGVPTDKLHGCSRQASPRPAASVPRSGRPTALTGRLKALSRDARLGPDPATQAEQAAPATVVPRPRL